MRVIRPQMPGIAACVALAAGCGGDAVDDPFQPPDPVPGPTPDLVSLDRLAGSTYMGFSGGLRSNGAPVVTPTGGSIVIISISMSNGSQEFAKFIELYQGHQDIEQQIGMVNCAQGGNALERWLSRPQLWSDCRQRVTAAGFALDQIKVVWGKNANQFTQHGRTLPDPAADYFDLVDNISELAERVGQEFPSVQAIFHSSRIYGGYVKEAAQPARGEPLSFEGGLAINGAIERWQAGQLAGAPWMGWGPYLWANAVTPNQIGISWTPDDFEDGGVDPHPSELGEIKVADALHEFFMGFDWYRR